MINKLMILLFPFLDFIPFSLHRYWLFRDKLRIPFRYITVLMVGTSAINSFAFYCINQGGPETAQQWTTLMRYSFMAINISLSFLLIKDSFPKLMFTYLLMLAWSFFVFGNANYLETRFFSDTFDHHPYLVYNIARIVLLLITYPFMAHFFRHTVKNALTINDERLWRYLWKIPLFSALFGMLYCTAEDIYAYASWQFLVSRYLMLLGGCYVSYVALKVLEISRSRTQLEEALKYADRNLLLQKKQYDSLSSHMEDTRKARHDLRQHLTAVQRYLEHDDKQGLTEYIEIYKSELPPDIMELYCRDEIVNAVIGYYATLSRDHKIRFEAEAAYPDHCLVSATEITVLLGNLLENAVEACLRDPEKQKFIRMRLKKHGNSTLLVLVDNTCTIPVKYDGSTPLSSKREGAGIGISSIQEIADRYHGSVNLEQKKGTFYTSVLLMLPSS